MKTINEVIEFLREQENSLKASENSMQELKAFKEKQAAKNAKLKKDILNALDEFMSEDEATAPAEEEKPVEEKETVSTPTMQEVIAAKAAEAAEAAEKAEAKKAADKLAADIAKAKELAEKAKAEQKARAEELKARSAKALAEAEARAKAKAEQEDAERAARAKEAQEAIAKATKTTTKHENKQKANEDMTPERVEKLTALYDVANGEYMNTAIAQLKEQGEDLTPYTNENGWFTRSMAACRKIAEETAKIIDPLSKALLEKGVTMDDLKYQRGLTFGKLRANQMVAFAQMYEMLPRSVEGLEPAEQKQHINQLIRQLMLNRLLNSESMDEWRSENGYASVAQIPDTDLAKAYRSISNKFMFDALYEETL